MVRSALFPPSNTSVVTEGAAPLSLPPVASVGALVTPCSWTGLLLLLLLAPTPLAGDVVACVAWGGCGSALCFASNLSPYTHQIRTKHVHWTLLTAWMREARGGKVCSVPSLPRKYGYRGRRASVATTSSGWWCTSDALEQEGGRKG